MIYTVTFNPCIDYVVRFDSFSASEVNRPYAEKIYPGGKGINVSVMLNNLKVENVALGFYSGFTGEQILNILKAEGCNIDFIDIKNSFSRINVKIKAEKEIGINGNGPEIDKKYFYQLLEKLDKLTSEDYLVLAGSIPDSLPDYVYEKILEHIDGKGVKVVVDATNDLLLNVLKYSPFLIKPNNYELEEMFNKPIKTDEEIIECAKALQAKGAKNVLVSRAEKGAILVDEFGKVHNSTAPKGKLVNSVGAGDSMVAGFLSGYIKTNDYAYALKFAIASGSASTFNDYLASLDEVEKVLEQLS